jgi:hypothetical protein
MGTVSRGGPLSASCGSQRRFLPVARAHACPTCPAGYISREDMSMMLKQLAGSSLSEEDRQDLISRVLVQASGSAPLLERLDLSAFEAALSGADLNNMVVEVPVDL